MSKKGRNYVVTVEIMFCTIEQAEEFCHQKTTMSGRIKYDLKDPAIIAMFGTSDGLVSECDFPGGMAGMGEAIQKELDAAVLVGAEFSTELKWEAS